MTAEWVPTSHGEPISVREFDALPVDTSHRYEIENGLLLVNARPAPKHSRALSRTVEQLNAQLPEGWEAFAEVEAEFSGRSPRRVPDIVVIPVEAAEQTRIRSDQIALAIEVATSGQSAVRDYIVKSREYAANNIACYWVIDLLDVDGDEVGLTIYTLEEPGKYTYGPRLSGTVVVSEPFPLKLDLNAIVGQRSVRR
ncbi:Uma2 family endonuclease [Nocardia panacis]|nr:Uma2 family endonuclease [Nocardia panacis]